MKTAIRCIIGIVLSATVVTGQEPETIPDWLDTLAPLVSLDPQRQFQTELFHITIKTNEPARVWYGFSPDSLTEYLKPVTIAREGETRIYFYAEDDFGNKSKLDSAKYVLDSRPPVLTVSPPPGQFSQAIAVELRVSEPARLLQSHDSTFRQSAEITSPLTVTDSLIAYIYAEDRAGNRSRAKRIRYIIDTSSISVAVSPEGGVFNAPATVSFTAGTPADVYYSFDPLASPGHFERFREPVEIPYGASLLRYFARNEYGQESSVRQTTYLLDTLPPVLRIRHRTGARYDTVILHSSEPAVIRYALSESAGDSDRIYRDPLVFSRTGRAFVRAAATDTAGNVSELLKWEHRYDKTPPKISASHASGVYTEPFMLRLHTSEPAKILYAMDGAVVDANALLYQDGIHISRGGKTVITYRGIDLAGNRSEAYTLEFFLDIQAPVVRARIEGSVGANQYSVSLSAAEKATIYYEIGDKTPTRASPRYTQPIGMSAGQTLRYFAVDEAGNRSEQYVMNELKNPMVHVSPQGGVYNRKINIAFKKNMESRVLWRLLPDTTFRRFRDSLILDDEGSHTLEYYSETPAGLRSPVRRDEFRLDWTSPHVKIAVKKGVADSISVFFESDENASIYYTTDGSSPLFSRSTKVAGNKFLMAHDRISMRRTPDARLAFYAEDVAGNRSIVTIVDVGRPRVVPSIPPGPDRVYDRVLSVSLNTFDDRSQIFYERHGKSPTSSSPIYDQPITLLASDTLMAYVVDVSGFTGQVDTFVYLIDLPPAVQFSWSPDTARELTPVTFDASGTIDQESPPGKMAFMWDFSDDGTFEDSVVGQPVARHAFRQPGRYRVRLRALDEKGRSAELVREIVVRGQCPEGMAFIAAEAGKSFCIDIFEWPNQAGKRPETGVSWIQARMRCLDAGKRLCTAAEWRYACGGSQRRQFPYGNRYRDDACVTQAQEPAESGQRRLCTNGFGVQDMIGNVWEWIDDRENGYPRMIGGAYRDGGDAHCGKKSVGSMTATADNVGFRCCK